MTTPAAEAQRSAPRTARAVARRELTSAIIASAREQLAEIGPAQLSVRAVARELGMASSAVYRYFPSRDELLTALLVIIYNELADVVARADSSVRRRSDFAGRWLAIARAMHGWAQQRPYDYAFLYGSPVPGYSAPEATIGPSARVTGVVIGLLHDVFDAGAAPRPALTVPRAAHKSLATFRELVGFEISDDLALRGLTAWGGLLGALTLELFGHLYRVIDDYDVHFDIVARRLCPI
jgi:AcrR family transcriptional regulator